ncbi:MAG: SDR family oxidoreductase [Pseudomonadota bacterium]
MSGTERIALVTGASQGIGAACARALLDADWSVAMAARSADKLEAKIAEFGAAGAKAAAIPCDVTDPGSVDALFAGIAARFGRLDFCFNNAGGNVPPGTPDEISFEDWRKVVSVNLDGAFLIASGAFKMMRGQTPQGGRIVNNGSISATTPRPGSAPYTASKHAISGLTKSIALDGRPFDIACGQIDIGNTASDMTAKMLSGVPQADGSMKPEPVMDVAHVAASVVHMAGLPLDANVLSLTVMATKMPLVGRG